MHGSHFFNLAEDVRRATEGRLRIDDPLRTRGARRSRCDPRERERVLDELLGAGLVEEYQVEDAGGRSTAAIRVVTQEATEHAT